MKTSHIVGYTFAGVVGLGALFVVGQFVSTASMVITAPTRVIQKTLQTDNIINNYEWYYTANRNIESRVNQIAQYKVFYSEASPEEKGRARIDLAAVQQSCRDLVASYNANSEKLNRSIFKGWDLPELIDPSTCE